MFPVLPLSLSSAKEINFFLLSILTKVDKHLSEWDNEICEQHLGQGLAFFFIELTDNVISSGG